MSTPNSKDLDFVRCIKCGKIMKCSRYDVAVLLDHIRNDHPEIEIIDTNTKRKRHFHATPINKTPSSGLSSRPEYKLEDADDSYEEKLKQSFQAEETDRSHHSAIAEVLAKYPEIKECEYAPHNPNAQVAYTRRYKLSSSSPMSASVLQQPFQYTLYRTSIEKWCPANGSIYCPKCGSNKRPLIKTKADRFTRNDCGACCLLSCWPFCFIPWILPGQNQEYLYCANCKTFLGLYDRQRNCLKPNRLYFASNRNEYRKKREQAVKIAANQTETKQLLENESPPSQSFAATNRAKSGHLTSIIVNGKELPPETVARLEKYKSYGSLVGIDFKALMADTDPIKPQVAKAKEREIQTAPATK